MDYGQIIQIAVAAVAITAYTVVVMLFTARIYRRAQQDKPVLPQVREILERVNRGVDANYDPRWAE